MNMDTCNPLRISKNLLRLTYTQGTEAGVACALPDDELLRMPRVEVDIAASSFDQVLRNLKACFLALANRACYLMRQQGFLSA